MLLIIFALGAVIGSFLNVCIYRIPKGESIIFPGSYCPKCKKSLVWYQLIPVFNYFLSKGKCFHCHEQISWRYPFIELITGLVFIYLYQTYGPSWYFLTSTFLACLLLVIAFIDIDHQIIPNRLVLFGLIAGLIFNVFFHNLTWAQLFFGFLAGGGILLLIALLSRGGMGGGDIKLAAMLGIYLGWPKIIGALFIASILGALVGLYLIILKKKSRQEAIPFGPFLALGAIMVLIKGSEIWDLYLKLILN